MYKANQKDISYAVLRHQKMHCLGTDHLITEANGGCGEEGGGGGGGRAGAARKRGVIFTRGGD